MTFSGHRLREARESAGLTRNDVAAQIRTNTTSIYNWEIGNFIPRADTLWRLARVVGKPLDYFFVEGTSAPSGS